MKKMLIYVFKITSIMVIAFYYGTKAVLL